MHARQVVSLPLSCSLALRRILRAVFRPAANSQVPATLLPHFSLSPRVATSPLVKITVLPFLLVLSSLPPLLPALSPSYYFKVFVLIVYTCVGKCVDVCAQECRLVESRGIVSPRAGVTGGYELPGVGLETKVGPSLRVVYIRKH